VYFLPYYRLAINAFIGGSGGGGGGDDDDDDDDDGKWTNGSLWQCSRCICS